jgi:hypothetical protein
MKSGGSACFRPDLFISTLGERKGDRSARVPGREILPSYHHSSTCPPTTQGPIPNLRGVPRNDSKSVDSRSWLVGGARASPSRHLAASSRLQDSLRRRRAVRQLARRPPRPNHQLAATIGTLAAEDRFGTRHAERALKRTDPRLRRLGRQIPVAALAART